MSYPGNPEVSRGLTDLHMGPFEFGTVAGSCGHDETVFVRNVGSGRWYRIRAERMPDGQGWPALSVVPVVLVDGGFKEP